MSSFLSASAMIFDIPMRFTHPYQVLARAPEQGPDSPLRAFLDLDDLICHQPMSLAMHRFSGCFARGLAQAKDRARAFIIPVPQVLDPVLLLNFEVPCVSPSGCFSRQPFHLTMDVHVECHNVRLLCGYCFLARGTRGGVSFPGWSGRCSTPSTLKTM